MITWLNPSNMISENRKRNRRDLKMCKSLDLIKDLGDIVTEMHSHIKELRDKQINCNLIRTDIQHQLENESINPSLAYNLAKAYHLASKERRVLGDEIEILQDAINRVSEGFGHIVYYHESKVKEYEFSKERREKGSECYNVRKLDLNGDVLKQAKEFLNQ